jgi:hypothetical protein
VRKTHNFAAECRRVALDDSALNGSSVFEYCGGAAQATSTNAIRAADKGKRIDFRSNPVSRMLSP